MKYALALTTLALSIGLISARWHAERGDIEPTLFSDPIYDGRGCCSHHGGQAACDPLSHHWRCGDGTLSRSCRC